MPRHAGVDCERAECRPLRDEFFGDGVKLFGDDANKKRATVWPPVVMTLLLDLSVSAPPASQPEQTHGEQQTTAEGP